MAVAFRESSPALDLKRALLADAPHFSFIQALRLLQRLSPEALDNGRIRPSLSLAFPAADVARINEDEAGNFEITATFLGLYGTTSPLPTFYTEDLFKEAREGSSVARDFLDIIHQRLYLLFAACWKKYRLLLRVAEDGEDSALDILRALAGFSDPAPELITYGGLFGPRPRSALGLELLLSNALEGVPVSIDSCVERTAIIAEDQRLCLGAMQEGLGVNSVLGEQISDCQGKFRVVIGPVGIGSFRKLVHGGEEFIAHLIKNYLTDPLVYALDIRLAVDAIEPMRLGSGAWSQLGMDTLMFTGKAPCEIRLQIDS